MTGGLVSVVIPVHNTAEFVGDALGSIREQSHGDLEIICIDDASTDDSLAVLRSQAAEDDRIRIVEMRVNIGLGSVRNVGLQHAAGEWVYFFDSDDVLERDAIEALVERATLDALDVLHFDASPFSEEVAPDRLEGYRRYYRRGGEYAGVWTGRDLFAAMAAADDWKPSMCLRLLRRSWLLASGIRSPEGVLHEDQLHAFRIAMAQSRAGYLARALFHRRLRADSITTSAPTAKHVLGLAQACGESSWIADLLGTGADSALGAAIRQEMGKTHVDAVHKYSLLSGDERRALAAVDRQTFATIAELGLIDAQVEASRLRTEVDSLASATDADRARLEAELMHAHERIAEYGRHPLRRLVRRARAVLSARRDDGRFQESAAGPPEPLHRSSDR